MTRTQNIGTRRTRGRASVKAPASVERYLDEAAQALATLDGDDLAAGFNEAAANIADYANAGIVTANRWLHERMTKYRAAALGRRVNPAFDALDQLRALASEITELGLLPKTPGRHRRLRELQAEYRKAERALAKSEGTEPRRRTHKVSRGYREINGNGKVFFQGELYYLRDGKWYLKNAPDDMAHLHVKVTERGLNILLWNAYHKKQREHNPAPWDKADVLQKQVSDLDDQVDAVWASDDLSATQRDAKLTELESKLRGLRKQLETEVRTAVYRSTTKNPRARKTAGVDEIANVVNAVNAWGKSFGTDRQFLENIGWTKREIYRAIRAGAIEQRGRTLYVVTRNPRTQNGPLLDAFNFVAGADEMSQSEINSQMRALEARGFRVEIEPQPPRKSAGNYAAKYGDGYLVVYVPEQVKRTRSRSNPRGSSGRSLRKPTAREMAEMVAQTIDRISAHGVDKSYMLALGWSEAEIKRAIRAGLVTESGFGVLRTVKQNPLAPATAAFLSGYAVDFLGKQATRKPRKRRRNAITPGARVKRTNARRMNPETSIADISLLFQGEINGDELVLEAPDGTPGELARIGKLDSLELKEDGARVEFENAFVGCDTDGDLHIVGFDLAMPEYAAPAGSVNDMGPIEVINYTTAKQHITGGKVTSFYHNFGEDTGVKPHLVIDAEGMPIISGGAYKIKTEGIVN